MPLRDKKWRLLVYMRGMSITGVCLTLSALIGWLYGERRYTVFALCAASAMQLVRAWFDFLSYRDKRPIAVRRVETPYMLRRDKAPRPRKPAFLMNAVDFDDDLVNRTMAAEEDFPDPLRHLARSAAEAGAAILLAALSFVFM